MSENYKKLVERYAGDRKLCNCRQAYRLPDGGCYHGCDVNIRRAQEEIIDAVCVEFSIS